MAGALLLGLGVACPARADVEHAFESWSSLSLQGRTNRDADSSFGLWLDLQGRAGDDWYDFVIRPGVGWYFDQRFSIWAGYVYRPELADGALDLQEHRPWQQFLAVLGGDAAEVQLRTRFEQRFIEREVGLRLRQLLRVQPKVAERWALLVWEEVLWGLNELADEQPRGFDENRVLVGLVWMPTDSVGLEVGYLFIWQPRPGLDTMVHALSVNLSASW